MPALTDLRIPTSVKLPLQLYSQLLILHVNLWYFSWPNFFDYMAECQLLETLAVYDSLPRAIHPEFPGQTLKLQSLLSLQLYFIPSTQVLQILSFISGPKLSHLVIAPFGPEEERPGFQTILRTNEEFPAIKNLVLALLHDDDDYAIRVTTRWFPCIEEALFVGSGASALIDRVLRQNMNVRHGHQIIWPHLRTLGVSAPLIAPHQLFASREAAECPIRRLYVDEQTLKGQSELLHLNADAVEIIEWDVWKELRKDGLYPDFAFGSNFGVK